MLFKQNSQNSQSGQQGASTKSAATATGQSHEALAHHWREAGEHALAVDEFIAAAEQAGRGWAKEYASKLYGDALKLVPEDDSERRRAITMRRMAAIQALIHVADVDRSG